MIDVSEATSILAKLIAGGKITEQEQQDLDEYASRFKNDGSTTDMWWVRMEAQSIWMRIAV